MAYNINMTEALNTHFYDSKWLESLAETNAKYEKYMSGREINNTFNFTELCKKSTHSDDIKQQANNWRNLILNSVQIDEANKISPNELLSKIENIFNAIENGPDVSIIDLYVEQLADISNGSCLQGQTTRLFQIYLAAVDCFTITN